MDPKEDYCLFKIQLNAASLLIKNSNSCSFSFYVDDLINDRRQMKCEGLPYSLSVWTRNLVSRRLDANSLIKLPFHEMLWHNVYSMMLGLDSN